MTPAGDSPANGLRVRFPKIEFLVLFIPVAIVISLTGYYFASIRKDALVEEMTDRDSTRLSLISGFIGAEVFNALYHLRSLSTESTTTRALSSNDPRRLASLKYSFLTLARRNPLYQQVRWINELGMEKIRVNRDPGGGPYIVSPKDLQRKDSRYYFEASKKMLAGEMYISPVDLNVEHGKIEMPHRPMLRVVTPVEDTAGNRRGIIVLNISMKHLFKVVDKPGRAGDKVTFWLFNRKGVLLNGWVDHSAGSGAQNQSLRYEIDSPSVLNTVMATDSGRIENPHGLLTWRTLSPVDTFSGLVRAFPEDKWANLDRMVFDNFSLILVAHRPIGTLLDMRHASYLLASLGVILIVSLYGFSLLFYLTSHTRERRAELSAAQARERESHFARMKELEERFHRLVEASSVAQLVVDRNGIIGIANQAAGEILGYGQQELVGMLTDEFLPAALRKTHVRHREAFMQAPEARKMGQGREFKAVRKDGSFIPVEIGLNPYLDNGRQLVLVNIVDLSHSENIERH